MRALLFFLLDTLSIYVKTLVISSRIAVSTCPSNVGILNSSTVLLNSHLAALKLCLFLEGYRISLRELGKMHRSHRTCPINTGLLVLSFLFFAHPNQKEKCEHLPDAVCIVSVSAVRPYDLVKDNAFTALPFSASNFLFLCLIDGSSIAFPLFRVHVSMPILFPSL